MHTHGNEEVVSSDVPPPGPAPMTRPLLYIHGFASSGFSFKAGVLREAFSDVYAPSLSHIPELAVQTLEEFLRALKGRPLLVGSSLGGYYAQYLAEKYDLPAVLVNPVVAETIPESGVVGLRQSYFDGSSFEFTLDHLQSLSRYRPDISNPKRFLALLQMGDRLLDHHRTLVALSGATIMKDEGGSHGFDNFAAKIPVIRDFAARQWD